MSAAKTFYYGGQAVIEGVMMRGRKSVAIAVRRPDGLIDVISRPLSSIYKGRLRETPFVRGVIVLIETMVLGMQALLHSADIAAAEETGEKISPWFLWGTLAVGLAIGVAVFFIAPLLIATYLIYPYVESALLGNLIEGIIRIVMFVLYLWGIGFMSDIRNVFAYHGAEHKTINAFEAGLPLETEYVKIYSTAHTRCGTSFLLVVLVLAIVVFTLIGRPPLFIGIISRVILIPVVAAIGYELIRFSAGNIGNPIVRSLIEPGLLLQSMTTREPNEKQMEAAIVALKTVLATDGSEVS